MLDRAGSGGATSFEASAGDSAGAGVVCDMDRGSGVASLVPTLFKRTPNGEPPSCGDPFASGALVNPEGDELDELFKILRDGRGIG